MRLLLQRPNHQRCGIALQESASDRGTDSVGDERPHLSMRNISEDSIGHSTCVDGNGGSGMKRLLVSGTMTFWLVAPLAHAQGTTPALLSKVVVSDDVAKRTLMK